MCLCNKEHISIFIAYESLILREMVVRFEMGSGKNEALDAFVCVSTCWMGTSIQD